MNPALSHSLAVYGAIQTGGGGLLCLAFLYLWRNSRARQWAAWSGSCGTLAAAGLLGLLYLDTGATPWLVAFALLQLVFAALLAAALRASAAWARNQREHLLALSTEIEQLKSGSLRDLDLDRLTGLYNQAALSKRMEDPAGFHGVAAVCDIDNFKEINDRFGHLVGDETLRNIGQLLRSSIRSEDEAFRWGGDEFVVLFRNQNQDVACRRMLEVERHLQAFQVRGQGLVPISLSWGTCESAGTPLRETLDAADREMYASKRRRAAQQAEDAAGV
ncbi:MAG TPA: GGDEF domain-containing protein [Bryobacteraceae bacterium]|nr:GGDEF domain-containing protein [Bryobacteraceae bacterium]